LILNTSATPDPPSQSSGAYIIKFVPNLRTDKPATVRKAKMRTVILLKLPRGSRRNAELVFGLRTLIIKA
jgi:uncharacterized protein YcbK (DUF882 family)